MALVSRAAARDQAAFAELHGRSSESRATSGNDRARDRGKVPQPSGAEQLLRVELEQESDGRWLAEVVELPGVLAYGATREEALAKAQALAPRVIADRQEQGERAPELDNLFIAV